MHELAWSPSLISNDRRSRLEPIKPAQAVSAQDRVRARWREVRLPGQDVGPDAPFTPSSAQRGDDIGCMPDRRAKRGARAVDDLAVSSAMPTTWSRFGG
jgi:hypothetical protein